MYSQDCKPSWCYLWNNKGNGRRCKQRKVSHFVIRTSNFWAADDDKCNDDHRDTTRAVLKRSLKKKTRQACAWVTYPTAMIFFTHPFFTSSFCFSSVCGVAKTNSPTVNWWTSGTFKLIFSRLPLITGRGRRVLRCPHFRRFSGYCGTWLEGTWLFNSFFAF